MLGSECAKKNVPSLHVDLLFFLLSFAFYVLCRAYSSIAFGLAEGWNETAIGVELDFAELFAYVHLNTMKCSPFGVNK